ncbi:MAG TPA: DPP IV N-terminal domain-containing protein [Gemmataceae bacterium]|nr:DPP IV N-terminal domain-containing protein [Gemmataceae bacterium]
MTPRSLVRLALPLLAAALCHAPARAELPPVQTPNYKQAVKYNDEFLRQFVYDTAVRPNWIGKTDLFWYSFRTSAGTRYWKVNPKQQTKEPLFDAVKLGTQLSESLQKPMDHQRLPLERVALNDDGTKLTFVAAEWRFEYDLAADKLTKLGKAPALPAPPGPNATAEERRRFFEQLQQRQQQDQQQQQDRGRGRGRGGEGFAGRGGRGGGDFRAYSPDRKAYLYAQKHNLYLVEDGKENAPIQLSRDGTEDYSFGGTNEDRKVRPAVTWSPDSKAFTATRADSRGVKDLFLVNPLAQPRPELEKYHYAMPGEDAVQKSELYVGDRAGKKCARVTPKWKDEAYSDLKWGKTVEDLRFVRRDRLLRHLEICRMNAATGEVKCVLAEGFENAYLDFQPVHDVEETGEMVWWSERSGWGHFYLYDKAGKLKNAVTTGDYRASRVVAVDGANRLLFFHGNGREPGESVYNEHLYCVHLDGAGLALMDPGDGSHQSVLSPSHQFVVDTCSRVDRAPVSALRDGTGRKLMDLEETDLSRLREVGWKMPETFCVKAADGVTDLCGNLWKPFDFDPGKRYPIIAHVYPGPQQEGLSQTFQALSANQQLAQLGFIVIEVGHRGGAPTRSKAYHSYGYGNLRDYGLADKKSAIEQLAARHPWIDIDRVGIFGHSGGGFMSAAAVLQKPYNEFFKAAVASSGNHDNNIYNNMWAERYHGLKEVPAQAVGDAKATKTGPPDGAAKKAGAGQGVKPAEGKPGRPEAEKGTVHKDQGDQKEQKGAVHPPPQPSFEIKVPTNAELAANLKGHLLLVHGDMDNNVHPANTMRLVDALIKANKRFDMLIIPGKRHAYGDYQPYFQQRMWDFFVEHLMGERQTSADIYEKGAARR